MNNSYLIHKYIDEGLNAEQEKLLFSELATSSTFREEFHRQMRIHIVASKDMNSILPPPELKNSIFAAVGFSGAVATEPTTIEQNSSTIPPKNNQATKGFPKIAFLALVALLSVVLTVAVYETMIIERTNANSIIVANIDYDATKIEKNLNNGTDASLSNLPSNIPVIENYNTYSNNAALLDNANTSSNRNNTTSQNNLLIVNSNNHSTSEQKDNLEGISKDASNIPPHKIHNSPLNDAGNFYSQELLANNNDKMLNSLNSQRFGSNRIVPIREIGTLLEELGRSDSKYVIVFEHSANQVLPKLNNFNKKANEFDNLSISGIYRLDENNSIGLEVSYQSYAQEFPVVIGEQKFTQIQNPQLFAITPFYRFSTRIGDYFKPYLQAGVGATSIGPISKIVVGSEVKLVGSLKANIGYGATALIYNVNDELFSTKKFGFVYGISYGF